MCEGVYVCRRGELCVFAGGGDYMCVGGESCV